MSLNYQTIMGNYGNVYFSLFLFIQETGFIHGKGANIGY